MIGMPQGPGKMADRRNILTDSGAFTDATEKEIETIIGYTFHNKELLRRVFEDASLYEYDPEGKEGKSNKRLENTGNKLLNEAVRAYVYKYVEQMYPYTYESKRLEMLLSSNLYLSAIGAKLKLDRFVQRRRWDTPPTVGKDSKGQDIPQNEQEIARRINANTMEALIAAILEDNKEGKGTLHLTTFLQNHLLPEDFEQEDPFFRNFCRLASPKFKDIKAALSSLTNTEALLCIESTGGPPTREGHPPAPAVFIRYQTINNSENAEAFIKQEIFDQTSPYPTRVKRKGRIKLPPHLKGLAGEAFLMALAFLNTHPWYVWGEKPVLYIGCTRPKDRPSTSVIEE